jgi:hypothetical protein
MKRFIILLVIISSVALILFSNSLKVNGSIKKVGDYKIVFVEKNDTLWGIIKNNCSDYKDIRKVIYDIKKLNNISSNIVPGQKIKIPLDLCK